MVRKARTYEKTLNESTHKLRSTSESAREHLWSLTHNLYTEENTIF